MIRPLKHRRFFFAFSLALLNAAAAFGQTKATLPMVVIGAPREADEASVLGTTESFNTAPASVSVIGTDALQASGVHRVSEAIEHDASVGESYATSGYYENFNLRGFLLDLGSSYRVNGMVVPGELNIALDNKASVEILKGAGTMIGGTVGSGGVVNFLTKRPADVRSVRAELSPRGGSYLGLDLGTATPFDIGLGVRLNAAHEEMRPGPAHADGNRNFLSLALDARLSPRLVVMGDLEYGQRSQPAVPGFQLLGGATVPENVDPLTNINQQPWSRPVRNEGSLLAVKTRYSISDTSELRAGLSDARARIDDSLAFPYGCNDPPYQYFCANGSYVLYDYRAQEVRRTRDALVALASSARTGVVRHEITFGAERVTRTIEQNQLYSTTQYDDAGRGLTGNLSTPWIALPAPPVTPVDMPATTATQTAMFVADQMSVGDWRAHAGLRLATIEQQPPATDARRHFALPELALVWLVAPEQRLYVSASRGVEFGSTAPLVAENAGQLLAPRQTSQVEAGWRREWGIDNAVSLAIFQMRRPFEFTDPVGMSWANLGLYRQAGEQRHAGIEADGRTRPSANLTLAGSPEFLHAVAAGTGLSDYDNKQVQNVPRLRWNAFAAYAWPSLSGGQIEARWLHVGQRSARADGSVVVPGYDRVDVGLSWVMTQRSRGQAKFMVGIQNVANERYWRDVGEAYSADLLFPGRPRSLSISATFEEW